MVGDPRTHAVFGLKVVAAAHTGVMRYLDLGTAKKISKIGLGTWQFGSREWGYGERYADQEAHAIVSRALELGVTLFDTAEIYGFGRSERILGRALGESMESVFLATKILPVLPVAPVVEQRAVASANRLGTRTSWTRAGNTWPPRRSIRRPPRPASGPRPASAW